MEKIRKFYKINHLHNYYLFFVLKKIARNWRKELEEKKEKKNQ
jgi:hypothetical protein